jgi:CRP-like cAMP-binding protein
MAAAARDGRYALRDMTDRRILETTQLLGALPPATLEDLRRRSTLRTVARNETLFRQGESASELFGVVKGRIAILTRSPDGRESLVAVLDEGALFGEMGMFDDGPRSADARALEESTLLVLEYDAVRSAIDAQPTLLWVIVRIMARRLRNTDEALADAVFLDVPARTAKRLLEIAGANDEFRLPMTQEDLAGLVGASRERVNKALSLFTKLGWLAVEGRGRYRILDRDALVDRASL